MSDGGRDRASLGVEGWKSSQEWSVQRSAVRSIAWLGLIEWLKCMDERGKASLIGLKSERKAIRAVRRKKEELARDKNVAVRAHRELKKLVVLVLFLEPCLTRKLSLHMPKRPKCDGERTLAEIKRALRGEAVRTDMQLTSETRTVGEAPKLAQLKRGITRIRGERNSVLRIYGSVAHRPNENKLSDRWRERTVPQISVSKSSRVNLRSGQRFAPAPG
jgi:hypothetical protein